MKVQKMSETQRIFLEKTRNKKEKTEKVFHSKDMTLEKIKLSFVTYHAKKSFFKTKYVS
jgi:hypothetical protein